MATVTFSLRRLLGVAGLLATLATVVVALLLVTSARAELLQPGGFSVTTTSSQAGAHPDLTTNVAFEASSLGVLSEHPKDIVVDLPAGFDGAPAATPRCPFSLFSSNLVEGNENCPPSSQVGTATFTITVANEPGGESTYQAPLYNLVPDAGQVAKLGFSSIQGPLPIEIVASVRPGDYGVRTVDLNVPYTADIDSVSVKLWGVPAAPSHNEQRGEWCQTIPVGSTPLCGLGGLQAGLNPTPFFTNPTQCGVPVTATLHADSWENRGAFNADGTPNFSDPNWKSESSQLPAIAGCNLLSFQPSLSLQPTQTQADTPTGATVDLKIPQNSDPEGFATAELRRSVVTLPAGMTLSPSAADGLQACSDAQVGLGNTDPPGCPLASKIGTATVTTPALPDQLTGSIYLAGPESGPITGPPYRIFLTVEGDGVLIKIPGTVTVDPATGQVTTTFDNNPQQPFSELKLEFMDGPRASLMTPSTCGTFDTTSDLTPWSAPESGPDAIGVSAFTINAGCTPGFTPTFTAGTLSSQAGAFTPFVLSLSRTDNEQQIRGLTFTMPPGVSAVLKGVAECSDADANAGTCPEASRIGSVTVGSGAGSDPYFLKGTVYLTGPYNGGPFGEVTVVPAVAGPFNLGNVVVKGSIRVDPKTAQPTVVSDPFPEMVGSTGIPTDVRRVDVTLDRPGFAFNPTNCDQLAVTGTLTSVQGTGASVSAPFQVANCALLAFKPKFTVSATGHPTRQGGAGLTVHISYPKGAEANLRAVKVKLPKLLPSRLTTLQKACPGRVFDVNPAACPQESRVGTATVATPLLASKLSGPAYFVSHGIAKFPDLAFVLQGEGVTVVLTGETFINEKTNVTTTTFRGVPDVPVSSFALSLPQGPHSALAGHESLCGRKLVMGTLLDAQNGAVIKQNTKVAVTGCRAKKASRKHHGRRR